MNKARFEVTPRQHEILTLLARREEWTMREIADLLGVSSAAATKNVTRLERKRLVKRTVNELDRRNILVSLTSEGRSVLDGALD